jgi:DNA polymerase-3 subunit gamma/tau
MASRRPTPAQIRERRARVAAVVLGVAFLGIAVIQGPKLLKMINGGSSSSPPATTTDASTTPGAPGSTTTSAAGVVAVAAAGPQLHGFSLFKPGTPFKPIPAPAKSGSSTTTTAGASSAGKAAAATAATTTPSSPPFGVTTPTNAATTPTTPATTTTAPAPPVTFTVPNGVPAAIVTVNGKKQLFGAGAEFPQEAPLFRLAAISKKGLKIGIVGGSYVDGQQYLVLAQGKKVTLLNQSDGSRFVIVFKKKTFAPADELTSPSPTVASGTTTAPAPAAAPAAAATTTAG